MYLIKLAFSTILLMEILRIYLEKKQLMKCKSFRIAKNPKYDGYQLGLVFMVYKLFDKKPSGSNVKFEIMSNQELATELHKAVIRKFEQRKF